MHAAGAAATVLFGTLLAAFGCVVAEPAGQVTAVSRRPIAAEIRLGAPAGPVNRLILGNNVQWVDRGDALLELNGSGFDPEMFALVRELHPTVLRYPGGSLADTFRWQSGNGPQSSRGTSEHFLSRQRQQVLFGTAEFLELCKRLGAVPLITVNTASGSPLDAADWLRSVNRPVDGIVSGPVHYWEVGNEPYLKEEVRPELAVPPVAFAARASAFIRAMREVDPTISIGVPLRRDRIGTLPAVAFPGFADTVLRAIEERFDFVALHNAYMPFVSDLRRRYSSEDLFRATMAGYQVVEDDIRQTRLLLDRFHPGRNLPIAITEYNAIFTLRGTYDNNIASLGGALYVADLLRVLAPREDILMANFWSLSGNWVFGAVSDRGQLRPAYHVLRAYSEILHGEHLTLDVRGPTFDAPAVGSVPATRGVPTIAALATTQAGRIRLLVINKSTDTSALVTLQGALGPLRAVTVRELGDTQIFASSHEAGGLRWRDVAVDSKSLPLRLLVGAHSLLWVDIEPLKLLKRP